MELWWPRINSDLPMLGCFGDYHSQGSLGTALFPTMQYCEAPSLSLPPLSAGFRTHQDTWRSWGWCVSLTGPAGFWVDPLPHQDTQEVKPHRASSNRTTGIMPEAGWAWAVYQLFGDEVWQLYVREGWILDRGPAVSGNIIGLSLMCVWGMETTSKVLISLEQWSSGVLQTFDFMVHSPGWKNNRAVESDK